MKIKNITTTILTVNRIDADGNGRDRTLTMAPGAEAIIYDSVANASVELQSLINAGKISIIGAQQPPNFPAAGDDFPGVAISATPPTLDQVLTATSATTANWQTLSVSTANLSDGNDLPKKSDLTAKGDIYVATASAAVDKLVLGAQGQVLIVDTAETKGMKWGFHGGYYTVVVAAPTGVATTDTANIQAAISGLPASGGTVALREGTYAIGTSLTSTKNVAIVGQGMDATILLADNTLGVNPIILLSGSSVNIQLWDLTIDMDFATRGSVASNDVDMTTTGSIIWTRVKFKNNTAQFNRNGISATGSPTIFQNCEFLLNGAGSGTLVEYITFGVVPQPRPGIMSGCNVYASVVPFSTVMRMSKCAVTGCTFTIDVSASTITTFVDLDQGKGEVVSSNVFQVLTGSCTTAINMSSGGSGNVVIIGNTAESTNAGAITTNGDADGLIVGNNGFSSYTGGTLSANI